MRIFELFEERKKAAKLYHLTDVTAALDILGKLRFKLSEKEGMSFARSGKSGYFTMMIGPDAVMLILNGPVFYKDFDSEPFNHDDGAKQLQSVGILANELEDRLKGRGGYAKIENIAGLFKEIRILRTLERSKGSNYYTDDQLQELKKLADRYDIPLNMVTSKSELRK